MRVWGRRAWRSTWGGWDGFMTHSGCYTTVSWCVCAAGGRCGAGGPAGADQMDILKLLIGSQLYGRRA